MPLMNQIAMNGDSGTPYILEHPDSTQADTCHDLAASVVVEAAKIKFSDKDKNQHLRLTQTIM